MFCPNSPEPVGAVKMGHVVLCENPRFCQVWKWQASHAAPSVVLPVPDKPDKINVKRASWMVKYLFFYSTWLLVWMYIYLEHVCFGWLYLWINGFEGMCLGIARSCISCALQERGRLGSIFGLVPSSSIDEFYFGTSLSKYASRCLSLLEVDDRNSLL